MRGVGAGGAAKRRGVGGVAVDDCAGRGGVCGAGCGEEVVEACWVGGVGRAEVWV